MNLFAKHDQAGLFANTDAFASVVERFGVPGSSDPARLLHARVAGGFDIMVDPSRGFDIGAAWVKGIPLSWSSPIRDHRPLDRPVGRDWIDRFTGGLLTSCGPENIGGPSEAGPMHGTFNHRPASHIRAWSGIRHDRPTVILDAIIEHAQVFGPTVRVERRLISDVDDGGVPRLQIYDCLVNDGPGDFPLQLLYHINIGAPVLAPGTTVSFEGGQPEYREPCPAVPDPGVMPAPTDEITEAVLAHRGLTIDTDGLAAATVKAPTGETLQVSWDAHALPHAYQWVLPTKRRWALGIEPATAPMFGVDRDGEHFGAPVLRAGESRDHFVMLTFYDGEQY